MKSQHSSVETPATPDNPVSVGRTLVVPADRRASRQASLLEPSPTSTHGESVAGDSTPITPSKLEDTVVLQPALSDYPDQGSNAVLTPQMGQLKLSSEGKDAAYRLTTVGHASASGSTPYTARTQSNAASPASGPVHIRNWPSQAVKFATHSNESDPFFVSDTGKKERSSSPSSSGAPTEDPSPEFRPREDRDVGEISGDNAQAIFSPSACVFVANLAATSTDEQLEHEVSRVFEQFGKVYVKIKRDNRGMPYAFCQYENEKDAEKAISLGHGLLIQGRACRTERARVNRSLYLSRTSGGSISEAHARMILAGYGPLEKLWTSSPTDREMFRLAEGIWVTFAFFQDCRDAQADFKDNPDYRLEQPTLPEDIRHRVERAKLSPFARSSPLRGRLSSPLAMYGHRLANSSVFIGNLPSNVSPGQLREHFLHCGVIKAVEIVAKANVHTPGQSVFAFIEFSSETEARKAIAYEAPLEGRRLRIELRESQDYAFTRGANLNSAGSPRNRDAMGSASLRSTNSLEAAMTRALALGIPAATTVQIFDPLKPENAENLPHTPMVSSIFPSLQYYSSPYSQYSPYSGTGSPSEGGNAGIAMYSPMGATQGAVSQYPYGSILNPHYGSAYHLSPYGYTNVANESNSPSTTQGHGHGESGQA